QNRGAGKLARVRETLRRGMMLEGAYGVMILCVTQLIKGPVMRLFAAQDSAAMVQMGVDYLTLMAFFYILPGMTNGIQGFFRGMGEMKTTLVCTLIQITIRTLIVFLLVPRVGITGAAWACAIGWGFMLVYAAYRYRIVRRALDEE
ncbi:MAG: MATE family efflux transporter, partial [Eubacteriales bacterium]|nr:MATE family efflux transporter [Eubacteriales bacterium]